MNASIHPLSIGPLKNINGLVHGTSPRHGQTEEGRTELLDLGLSADADGTHRRRQWFLRSLRIDTREIYLVRQVHGERVFVLDDPALPADAIVTMEADALVTRLEDRPIAVLTADCIPIVVYDPEKRVVGVIHAGRKGTAQNIFSKTVAVFKNEYGSRPENLLVGLGPGIGRCCYEVEENCIIPFRETFDETDSFVTRLTGGKYLLDLFAANEADGRRAGVRPENMFRSGRCTACENDRLFSYRKEGPTGRMMTLAMLRRPA